MITGATGRSPLKFKLQLEARAPESQTLNDFIPDAQLSSAKNRHPVRSKGDPNGVAIAAGFDL
jgi:hypothetical protein